MTARINVHLMDVLLTKTGLAVIIRNPRSFVHAAPKEKGESFLTPLFVKQLYVTERWFR